MVLSGTLSKTNQSSDFLVLFNIKSSRERIFKCGKSLTCLASSTTPPGTSCPFEGFMPICPEI